MSFYEHDGAEFRSTKWTAGPWSPDAQHGGPPAALTGRAIELLPSDGPMRVTRFAFEIVRPIPVAPLTIDARVVRPGKRVQLCEAAVLAGGDVVALARAWRLRVADQPQAPAITDGIPPAAPGDCEPFVFPDGMPDAGYMRAMELRTITGSLFRGPSAAWFRMGRPLVAGEEPTPLQRVLIAADSGNGISAVLDFSQLFINVDLTVHLVREPEGEWVALDSRTRIEPDGVGATESFLWDAGGRLGTAAQSLFVAAR